MKHKAKEELRSELKERYAQCNLRDYTQSAVLKVASSRLFLDADEVLAYTPMSDEVPFMDELRHKFTSKKWYFPTKVDSSFESDSGEPWMGAEKNSIILVPARAVNTKGERLGRGGGWYDRFLSAHRTLPSLTVIPDFALLQEIPVEDHDVAVRSVLVATLEDF